MTTLVQDLLDGDRRALARVLTAVENNREGVQAALEVLFPYTGNAHIIGVTGAPGTGKSTLVSALARAYRQRGQTVGILAVDPTSPFTGGAVLGDRIRMSALHGDSGVFIRSMATRGSLGGLAKTTQQAIWVMDAAGFDVIVVETVGAGQSEVDIAQAAHTTIVIEAPGLGDGVQSIKAGILEIADILVVNKADRPGAINTVRTLKTMLELGHPTKNAYVSHHGQMMETAQHTAPPHDLWIPRVLETVATDDSGIEALVEAIASHQQYLKETNTRHKNEYDTAVRLFYEAAQQQLLEEFLNQIPVSQLDQLVTQIQKRQLTPQSAVRQAMSN